MADDSKTKQDRKSPYRKKFDKRVEAERRARELERAQTSSARAALDALPECPGAESGVGERVDYCWALMTCDAWHGYATRCELAAAWDVTESAVRLYAAEASRRLRLDEDEVKAAQEEHARFCRMVRDRALVTPSLATGIPDWASVLKADERMARLRGVEPEPPKKSVELTGKNGGPVAMSLEDLETAVATGDANAEPVAKPAHGDANGKAATAVTVAIGSIEDESDDDDDEDD